MRTTIKLLALVLISTYMHAQEKSISLSMGKGYSQQVYYKLDTQQETAIDANSWDIAFLRNNNRNISIRTNNLIEVFEASSTISDWKTIDVAEEKEWTPLYNSDTDWSKGSIDQGSASYGWGEYSPATHHVTGSVIFVFKYADGTYRKFINEDYFGGYTFKYATWDAETSTWSEDKVVTLSNSDNPDYSYNYYSLQNHESVIAEAKPENWDFVFTKYYTNVGIMYPVTGVLINSDIEVAVLDQNEIPSDAMDLTFKSDINSIGYDWKELNDAFQFEVNTDKSYYLKYANNEVYKLNFETFAGSASGDLSFRFSEVSQTLSNDVFSLDSRSDDLKLYQNTSNELELVYTTAAGSLNDQVVLYNSSGQNILTKSLHSSTGINSITLNLPSLNTGVYIVHLLSDNEVQVKKLLLN